MKLVPGTLYFISEVDVLTGEEFDYYKIGLVKESRQGNEFNRAGEHQTGNPRRLEVRHTVESPAINDLETHLHDIYATERIHGEWFLLPGNLVKNALTTAQELALEQIALKDATATADEFSEVMSSDEMLSATPEAAALFSTLQQAKLEIKAINGVLGDAKKFLLGLPESSFDISPFVTTTRKVVPKLQEKELLAKYPDIYNQFLTEKTSISPSFKPVRLRDLDLSLPKKLEVELIHQAARLASAGKMPSEATVQEIHFHHLELLKYLAFSNWREDQCSTHLKSLIKAKLGIEGIATWSRKEKTTPNFLVAEFKRAHPELAEEFTVVSKPSSSAVVDMRRYIWPRK